MKTSSYESLTGDVDRGFPEYADPPGQPMPLVVRWFEAAKERGVREPRAMSLATADRAGRTWQRIIAILSVDARGILFCSHSGSRKGREIAATGWASGLFYWRETSQQIIIGGPVEPVDPADADAMWRARPVPLHAMSSVSHQSEPLADPDALRADADALARTGRPLPRPAGFAGYLLVPHEVEFWAASADRLHRRLRYRRRDDGWLIDRLQP